MPNFCAATLVGSNGCALTAASIGGSDPHHRATAKSGPLIRTSRAVSPSDPSDSGGDIDDTGACGAISRRAPIFRTNIPIV